MGRYHYLIYLVLVPVLKDGKEKKKGAFVAWTEWNEMIDYEKHIICETYCCWLYAVSSVELGGATSIKSS